MLELKFKVGQTYLGRIIYRVEHFKVEGTFQSFYASIAWLHKNGYSYGSTDTGRNVAVQKGEYTLTQKWKNFDDEEKELVDGVIYSEDYREGDVYVLLLDKK